MGKNAKEIDLLPGKTIEILKEEELSDHQFAVAAMDKAIEAFHDCMAEQDIDSAYFSLRLTCWLLSDHDFSPLEKIEIDTRSSADGKYHED